MLKTIRRIVLLLPLLAVLGAMAPAAARADDPGDLNDANTAWAYAESSAQPDPTGDPNTYWKEVQVKQLVDPGQ
jgi:hypothetical protein